MKIKLVERVREAYRNGKKERGLKIEQFSYIFIGGCTSNFDILRDAREEREEVGKS